MSVQTLADALASYEPVIGLEVHAQLRTDSKLFSAAPNRYEPDHPNKNIRPYCVGLPGVLPVVNRRAVEMAVKAGLALGCQIRRVSVWSRKQYFYPDLPKGYQISQYDRPLCEHGSLEVEGEDGPRAVHIDRIHMEEDAGKSVHMRGAPTSALDYNRAGVPLIEIVSAPELRSAAEAGMYLRRLRSILRALEVCDGNMEEGSFRCDANVSIRPHGQEALGQRTELKNINSFRFVEQAIEVEILRQAKLLEAGQRIEQETRLFDADRRETRSMRSKEEAPDYRYFPDPDLPPLIVEDEQVEALKATLPELPLARHRRYLSELSLPEEHALLFSEEHEIGDYFDAAVKAAPALALPIANLVKGELLRELKDDPEGLSAAKLTPATLAELVQLKEDKKISSSQQKKLFLKLWREGGALSELMKAEGEQLGEDSILPIVRALIADHPKEAEALRGGKKKLYSFFIGQVMKQTRGKADPAAVKALIEAEL